MKPRLLVVGAGGHARVVVTIAKLSETWELAGILDRIRPATDEDIGGIRVSGPFEDALFFFNEGIRHACLAIGDNDERAILHSRLISIGFNFPVLRHPSAWVEGDATIGDASVICAGAIICAQAKVGKGAIINTGVVIDHETIVGDYAHVATGCRIAGRVCIGANAMLGVGTCVRDKVAIGARAILGAGSVVVDDIPPDAIAYGSPARVARLRTP